MSQDLEARAAELKPMLEGQKVIVGIDTFNPQVPTLSVMVFNERGALIHSAAYLEETNEQIAAKVKESVDYWATRTLN